MNGGLGMIAWIVLIARLRGLDAWRARDDSVDCIISAIAWFRMNGGIVFLARLRGLDEWRVRVYRVDRIYSAIAWIGLMAILALNKKYKEKVFNSVFYVCFVYVLCFFVSVIFV